MKYIDNDVFYKILCNDNNIHIITIIENIVYTKIMKKENNFYGVEIIDETKKHDYMSLSGVVLLFTVYPGYEINIECDVYNKIINSLMTNITLTEDIKTTLIQSVSLHNQVLTLLNHKKQDVISNHNSQLISKLVNSTNLSDRLVGLSKLPVMSFASEIFINDKENLVYKRLYNKDQYIAEVYSYLLNNINRSAFNFDILKMFSYDNMSKIICVSKIIDHKPLEIDRVDSLIHHIKKTCECILNFTDISKKRTYDFFTYDTTYLKENLYNLLYKYVSVGDYDYVINRIFWYILKFEIKIPKEKVYYINGDFSLDNFIDETGKYLFHDWNGAKFSIFEEEIANFFINVSFLKNKDGLNDNDADLLKNINELDILKGIDFDLFKFFCINRLVISGNYLLAYEITLQDNLSDIFEVLLKKAQLVQYIKDKSIDYAEDYK